MKRSWYFEDGGVVLRSGYYYVLFNAGGIELYKNIRTCVKMTWAEGGVGAFFKGATGRFLLIGPLFGVVLFTYEVMPKLIPL